MKRPPAFDVRLKLSNRATPNDAKGDAQLCDAVRRLGGDPAAMMRSEIEERMRNLLVATINKTSYPWEHSVARLGRLGINIGRPK